MKTKITVNETKYLTGPYANIITIVLTDPDQSKIEQKTKDIIQITKYAHPLIITKTRSKAGGESTNLKSILVNSGKDHQIKNKSRRSNTISRTINFEKPKPHLVGKKK